MDEAGKARLELFKINQLRLRARRQALNEYKNRYVSLLDKNIALKSSIESEEAASHNQVKTLLRKYEKFRGGIATLHEKFAVEKARADADLEKVKARTDLSLTGFSLIVSNSLPPVLLLTTINFINLFFAVLQEQVDEIEAKLREEQKQLNILMNYKVLQTTSCLKIFWR